MLPCLCLSMQSELLLSYLTVTNHITSYSFIIMIFILQKFSYSTFIPNVQARHCPVKFVLMCRLTNEMLTLWKCLRANSDVTLALMALKVNLKTFRVSLMSSRWVTSTPSLWKRREALCDPLGFPYLYSFRGRKLELTRSTWRQHRSSHVLPQCLLSPWALSFFPFSFLPYKYLSSPIREWGNLNTHAHTHTHRRCH